MNKAVFNDQMKRLLDAWPTSFPSERILLIWEKVNGLSDYWIKKSIDHFISHNRSAPLPADFLELARIEKNSQNLNTGFPERASQIHPSENSIFSKEDIAEMFNIMGKRLSSEISYAELDAYGKMIQNAVDGRGK